MIHLIPVRFVRGFILSVRFNLICGSSDSLDSFVKHQMVRFVRSNDSFVQSDSSFARFVDSFSHIG